MIAPIIEEASWIRLQHTYQFVKLESCTSRSKFEVIPQGRQLFVSNIRSRQHHRRVWHGYHELQAAYLSDCSWIGASALDKSPTTWAPCMTNTEYCLDRTFFESLTQSFQQSVLDFRSTWTITCLNGYSTSLGMLYSFADLNLAIATPESCQPRPEWMIAVSRNSCNIMNSESATRSGTLVQGLNSGAHTLHKQLAISGPLVAESPKDLTSTTALEQVNHCRICADWFHKAYKCLIIK